MTNHTLRIPHQANFVTANGIELACLDAGSGPVIVFVPGWTFTSDIFEHQIAEFAKTHRVIAFDPRSHGRSDPAMIGNHYAQQARDLAAVVDALNLDKFILVGWSAGSACGLEYFKQFGTDTVEKFVSIDQSPKPYSDEEGDWCVGGYEGWKGLYQSTISDRSQGTRAFCEWLTLGNASKSDVDWFTAQSMNTHPAAAANLLIDLMFRDDVDVAQSIGSKIPVLNIVREDQSKNATDFVEKHGIQTSIKAFGGHAMFWEEPDKFNSMLRA